MQDRGRPPSYPYARWTDGRRHNVDPAKYGTTEKALRNAIYKHAHRKNLKVSIESVNGRLAVQFS